MISLQSNLKHDFIYNDSFIITANNINCHIFSIHVSNINVQSVRDTMGGEAFMKFKLCVISDVHGTLNRFREIQSQIKQLKPDLVIQNGDFLQGDPSTYFYNANQLTNPFIELANEIINVGVYGNHEFNTSLEEAKQFSTQFTHPIISCNLGNFTQPYVIYVIGNFKIAIIGATTALLKHWDEHNLLVDLHVERATDKIKQTLHHVQQIENPDFIIVSYHGGFVRNPETNYLFSDNELENEGNTILDHVKGIDLLITGHQHLILSGEKNGIHYVQPGSHSKGFFEIDITINNGKKEMTSTYHPIHNPTVLYPKEVENWLDTKLVTLTKDYTYKGLLESRLTSHPFIQLLHHMQIQQTGAQISVCELMFHEKGGFKKDVTIRDIWHNANREITLKVIELNGEEIKQLIEQSAAVFALDNQGDINFSTIVYPNTIQPFQYDFWGGLDYTIQISEPLNNRVKNLSHNGKPISASDTFTVCISSYRLTGYDFLLLANKPVLFETTLTYPALLEQFCRGLNEEELKTYGYFKVIP